MVEAYRGECPASVKTIVSTPLVSTLSHTCPLIISTLPPTSSLPMVLCPWSPDRAPRLWCCPVAQSRTHKGWDSSTHWPSASWREGWGHSHGGDPDFFLEKITLPQESGLEQWTIIEREAGRAQWEGYRFKVSEDFQQEYSNPEMGYRESCGLLFHRNAEITTEKVHHGLSAEFSGAQGASSSPFPQPRLFGSPAYFAVTLL